MTARDELIHALARDSAAAVFAGDMYGANIDASDIRDATDMVDAAIREALQAAADRLAAWGQDGHLRLAEDEHGTPQHPSPFYMWEDADIAAGIVLSMLKQETL
jgi:hypothetical protein